MARPRKNARYAEYSTRIQQFALAAIKRLNERYGNAIPEFVMMQLDKCCETLEIIDECRKACKDYGMLIDGEKGGKKINPAVQALSAYQSTLNRLLTALMLTPNSEDKARKVDHGQQNMLLDELINGSSTGTEDYDEEYSE